MTTSETPPPVLSYHSPARAGILWRMGYRVARAMRHVPRPSRWTIVLAVLAGLAIWWLWADHGVWRRTVTLLKGGLGGRLSPDGKRLIVGIQAPMQIYDLQMRKPVLDFGEPGEKALYWKWSPDGSRMVNSGGTYPLVIDAPRGSGAGGGEVRILMQKPELGFVCLRDATDGKVLGKYVQMNPESSGPYPLFSPDGRRLVVTEQERAMLYDSATGAPIAQLAERDGEEVVGMAFISPDSRIVAINMGLNGRVIFCGAADGAPIAKYQVPQEPDRTRFGMIHAAFSPDSSTLAYQVADRLYLIDPSHGTVRGPPVQLSEYTYGLTFSPDSKRVLVAGRQNRPFLEGLSVIDTMTGLTVGTRAVRETISEPQFRWSPDGSRLLFRGWTEPFNVLDPTTLKPLPGPGKVRRGESRNMVFSRDFSQAATIVGQARVDVLETSGWSRRSSIEVPLPKGRPRQVIDVAFAWDNDHLLTSLNGDVDLWHRRRPEPEWGIVMLPHCWLAITSTVAFLVFAARDVFRFYRSSRA